MLANNDPRLLVFSAIAVALGFVFSALDIAQSPLFLWKASAKEGLHSFMIHAGYLGWYFVVMYLFSKPGWRQSMVAVAPGLVLAFLYLAITQANFSAQEYFLIVGFTTGIYLPALLIYHRRRNTIAPDYRRKVNAMLYFWTAIVLLALLPPTYLNVTMFFHPTTFDLLLYHFESTMGFLPSAELASLAQALPTFQQAVRYAYDYMPLGYAVLLGAQLARPERPAINLLAAWLISEFIAWGGYHLLPVSGPRFLFLDAFPSSLPAADELPLQQSLVIPASRNGVPSMHFGWALMLWLNANLLSVTWLRIAAALLMAMNFIATMALGEHYFVDLVIAAPVVVAVQALCMTALPWNDALRRRAMVGGIGIWLAWVVALRFGVPVFKAVPGLSWLAMIGTAAASIWLYVPLVRAFKASWANQEKSQPLAPKISAVGRELRMATALFMVSGFAGLMYEVLFSKVLALTFGSTATATYTVLATYMGGIAIGAWLGGRLAVARANPLVLYAICELGIAVYCALTPAIFVGIRTSYVVLAADIPPDASILTVYRLVLGMGALIVPTILMGMTLPLMARFFEKRAERLGKSVAILYGANTLGAALGALLAGYFIIPMLGVFQTTLLAVLLNLLVAYAAVRLHKSATNRPRENLSRLNEPESPVVIKRACAIDAGQSADLRRLGYIALAILGIGGVVTLAIEIKYMHLLAIVAGNSTYAFSLMLFTFLLGLGAGAEVARRLLKKDIPLGLTLGLLEFGLATVILAGVFNWSDMPAYFASFAKYPVGTTFASREVVRGVVCWLAMFPPALFIGAIYPIAMECIGRANPQRKITSLGAAAALNTAGNIAGVLLGGFVLLPYLGVLRSIQLLAAVCVLLGAITLWQTANLRRWIAWPPAAIATLLLIIQPSSFNYTNLASGANVYFAPLGWGEVIDHAESIDGGLTSVAISQTPGAPAVRTLLTNGKFQGNDSIAGEMQAQIGFSLAPLLHTSHRDQALIIGYGTGVSSRVLHSAGFAQLDVIDLSADILRLANEHFAKVNDRVSEEANVNAYVTDGRNFLMLHDKQYDVIGMEISSIWFAGAASLYNREFYQLAKKRLRPHGVLQQWMQLHHISTLDILRIIGSVRSEFRYVWLYLIGGQGIIVATNDPTSTPRQSNATLLKQTGSLRPLLEILGQDPGYILGLRLLEPAGTDAMLDSLGLPPSYWISTDDNLALEYDTPKGNVFDTQKSFTGNKKFIVQFSQTPERVAASE